MDQSAGTFSAGPLALHLKKKKNRTRGLGLEQVLLNMVRESFPGRINTTGVGGFPKRRRNLSFLMLTSNNMFLGVSNGKIKI